MFVAAGCDKQVEDAFLKAMSLLRSGSGSPLRTVNIP